MAELALWAPQRSWAFARPAGGRDIDLTRGEDGWWRATAPATDYASLPQDLADPRLRDATAVAANFAPHPQRPALLPTARSTPPVTDPGVAAGGEVVDLSGESAAIVAF